MCVLVNYYLVIYVLHHAFPYPAPSNNIVIFISYRCNHNKALCVVLVR